MSDADVAHYLLVLGSAREDAPARVAQARERLSELGELVASSTVVSGPSVSAGDPHVYANQAVRLSSSLARADLAVALKQLETTLGRRTDDAACAIDIDLAREYSAAGHLRWENPAKLAHRLFLQLAAQVEPPPI
ncbi:MAG TPA: 2-amino-4-hydroxy-6-hydroxymethyldihydropteridine diphosphokinase [Pseudoxanthomonas sp.]|jgi:7,8-dihydro-6-hydroxymethylpterin-pyrophosphokinase|nr:2-amino-4-hydroxy-6-hydroxymethyldihydropteridine diphosphokinase [Pseudoxanthomonas sp.]